MENFIFVSRRESRIKKTKEIALFGKKYDDCGKDRRRIDCAASITATICKSTYRLLLGVASYRLINWNARYIPGHQYWYWLIKKTLSVTVLLYSILVPIKLFVLVHQLECSVFVLVV